jgi:DNA-binding NarL/FixJ family response regulator
LKTSEIKTCLLVTDDPDDHQTFTEAVANVAGDTIVLIVVESGKAIKLLSSLTHVPDHVIIDLSMHGLEIEEFLNALRTNSVLTRVPVLTYGSPIQYAGILDRMALIFFAKEYEYSKLQSILSDFLHNKLA